MRILLAARYTIKQQPIGGVQSWIEAIKGALKGHQVDTWGRGEPVPTHRYDMGILANWCDTSHLAAWCDKYITVSHGIIKPERPGPNPLFTSEEVRNHWYGKGDIIRQPIDLKFWSPADVDKVFLTQFSYRSRLPYIPEIAETLGLEYIHVADLSPIQVRAALRQSACVLATGRAAVEAMACGVPVVICDDRPYQGALLDTDTTGAMKRNYSGRGGVLPDPVNVTEAILDAIERGSLRRHAERYHDAEKIADDLLAHANWR